MRMEKVNQKYSDPNEGFFDESHGRQQNIIKKTNQSSIRKCKYTSSHVLMEVENGVLEDVFSLQMSYFPLP